MESRKLSRRSFVEAGAVAALLGGTVLQSNAQVLAAVAGHADSPANQENSTAGRTVIEVKPGSRVVFLDLDSFEATHNVAQRVMEAQKHPHNPLLPLGDMGEWDSLQARPWECRTVIYDEEDKFFKCWYAGKDLFFHRWWMTGYAISEDGVSWEKPRLRLHEYNGSNENNICYAGMLSSVIKDPAEPDPEKRYKAITQQLAPETEALDPARGIFHVSGRGERWSMYSRDGIHWNKGKTVKVVHELVVLLRDDQDPNPNRRYKLIWQSDHPANKPGPKEVRTKSMMWGPDIEHLMQVESNPILHPNDGLEQENHFVMLAPYHGQYVMPYEYGWYMPNRTGTFGQYCADIRLAVSKDGEHYRRVLPSEKVICRGLRGEWDDGFLVISDKLVVKDNKMYLYYCGNGEDWTSWPKQNKSPRYPLPTTGIHRLSRMGLATLRLDGFTCIETPDRETPGSATTRPIHLTDRNVDLVLNTSDGQQGRSWVEVEVLNAGNGGSPLPGFSRTDCTPACRDDIRVPVRWNGKTLADAGIDRVRLRFWFCGAARLYSFGFDKH